MRLLVPLMISLIDSAAIVGESTTACIHVCEKALGICNVQTFCTPDDRCEYLYWTDEGRTDIFAGGANIPELTAVYCNEAVQRYRVSMRRPPSPPSKLRRTSNVTPSRRTLLFEGEEESNVPIWSILQKTATIDQIIFNMHVVMDGRGLEHQLLRFPFIDYGNLEEILTEFNGLVQRLFNEVNPGSIPSWEHGEFLANTRKSIRTGLLYRRWSSIVNVIFPVFVNTRVTDPTLNRIGRLLLDCHLLYTTVIGTGLLQAQLRFDMFEIEPPLPPTLFLTREAIEQSVADILQEHLTALERLDAVSPSSTHTYADLAWASWSRFLMNILSIASETQREISDLVCGELTQAGLRNLVHLMGIRSTFSFVEINRVVRFMKTVCTRDQIPMRFRRYHMMHILPRTFAQVTQEDSFLFHITSSQRSPEMVTEAIEHTMQVSWPQWVKVVDIDAEFANSPSEGNGVFTEFIQSVLSEATKPSYGLFELNDLETSVQPKAVLTDLETVRMLHVGRLIGIALIEGKTPEIRFTKGTLFCIQNWQNNRDISNAKLLEYAIEISPEFVSNLMSLRNPEVLSQMLGLDFPNSQKTLTGDNVEEYIRASLYHKVIAERSQSIRALVRGIYDLIPPGFLDWFDLDELDIILGGDRSDINVVALRETTTVHNTFTESMDHQEAWFWEIVEDMSQDELGNLLRFVSGSRTTPIGGFDKGTPGNKWMQVTFDTSIADDWFPKGQLCFKQIRIPRYTNKETMKLHLMAAINTCDTIDIH